MAYGITCPRGDWFMFLLSLSKNRIMFFRHLASIRNHLCFVKYTPVFIALKIMFLCKPVALFSFFLVGGGVPTTCPYTILFCVCRVALHCQGSELLAFWSIACGCLWQRKSCFSNPLKGKWTIILGCICLLPPELIQDISSGYLLFGKSTLEIYRKSPHCKRSN